MEKINELVTLTENTQVIKDGNNVFSSWNPVSLAFNDDTSKEKIAEITADVKQLRDGYDTIAKVEKGMFTTVAKIIGGKYHQYCKGFKSVNEFISVVTDGKIKKSTITEYVKVANRFYYASGKPRFDGVELMDTHALYLLSNLDDEQFKDFEDALLLFTKKTKQDKFTRSEMLTVFKAIQDKKTLEVNDGGTTVEDTGKSKKTNYKEKSEKLEEALETVKSEVVEKSNNLSNAIDCLNAIADYIDSNKSIKSKEFNDMLTRYKLNDLLLKSHEQLENEKPFNN